ncbi:MAG: peptide/nickel transport system permease protein [Microbacteriaceae bacterium]|jgi:peptide/nickel transport system permease protein|nr:peptide/nickel transport system permease protein [Microbacteriaceae bacterium]
MLSLPEIKRLPAPIGLPRLRWPFSIGESIAVASLALVVILSIVGPLLSPYSPIIPSGAQFLAPGSPGHLLGTDNLGMDIATRLMVGARTSLFAAVVTTACTATLGLIVGTIAGFVGGWLDTILMRITDIFLAFPGPIVAMAISAALGASLSSSIVGIAIVWWPLYARIARGEVRRTATSMHVEAARMSGSRGIPLVLRHILPATLPTVAITASLDIGGVIAVLSALSFIGLGTPAPAPELGLMASTGMQYLLSSWWIPVLPGLCVGVLALLCNYTGDGLRGVLRSRGV